MFDQIACCFARLITIALACIGGLATVAAFANWLMH
jgi:hypothetical protein